MSLQKRHEFSELSRTSKGRTGNVAGKINIHSETPLPIQTETCVQTISKIEEANIIYVA